MSECDGGFAKEDIEAALAAIGRNGGVDDQVDGEGEVWRPPCRERAMRAGLAAALASRARRESRAAMDAVGFRVASRLAVRQMVRGRTLGTDIASRLS